MGEGVKEKNQRTRTIEITPGAHNWCRQNAPLTSKACANIREEKENLEWG